MRAKERALLNMAAHIQKRTGGVEIGCDKN